MEKQSISDIRVEIELLCERHEESIGDERYINHPSSEVRLWWAFKRPSGSHVAQLSDIDTDIAIMAFNHSRLGAYERFSKTNPQVMDSEELRLKIANRARMLFRALADDDLSELALVLGEFPQFVDLAFSQLLNGRRYYEIRADIKSADFLIRFFENAGKNEASEALISKIGKYSEDELSLLAEKLDTLKEPLHPKICNYLRELLLSINGTHSLKIAAIRQKISKACA
jgi:hypothetical protein